MKNLREAVCGLVFALLTAMLVLGALTLSLVEGKSAPDLPPLPTETPFELPTFLPIQATQIPFTRTPGATPTITCPKPAGWVEYIVRQRDTLEDLALRANLSTSQLLNANCLLSADLVAGAILFLPPFSLTVTGSPFPSHTPSRCGPPPGWIPYRIQSQDTLFRISLRYGVSVPQLQYANCMGTSTFLRTGDVLYVPNVATRTPEIPPVASGTLAPTDTSIPEIETPVPTSTLTPESTPFSTGTPEP